MAVLSLALASTSRAEDGDTRRAAPPGAAIPFAPMGMVAGQHHSGEGLAVTSSAEGALLNCVFQRLKGQATTNGLWLVSTAEGATGEPFRVLACGLGRGTDQPLPRSGKVEIFGDVVRFLRPSLVEEYAVGIDGLRQDFVMARRPEGCGSVRLELELEGAQAAPTSDGVRLVLTDGGRTLVYNRLQAQDAWGKNLAVRLEVVSAKRLVIVLDDAAAEYPVRIDPTFSDAHWMGLGSGMNGGVYALAVSGGTLYAGGSFTLAGGIPATNIAQWNGSSWSALGSGVNGAVYALAVSGGTLYAGGNFTTAGGTAATNIAQWNGSSWSALGPGMNGSVYALAASGGRLYVGVESRSQGLSADGIAQWDGTNWSALASGGPRGTTYALAVSGGKVYAGGLSWDSDQAYVAQWDGTNWSVLGLMDGSLTENWGGVFALAVSGGKLYAGGVFTSAGGVAVTNIAQWDGTNWSALGWGLNGPVRGGPETIHPIYWGPGSRELEVDALAVSGGTLYAGGYFTLAGGSPANFIAQWDGSNWSPLGTGTDWNVNAVAVCGGMLYAGGNFTAVGGKASAYGAGAVLSPVPVLTQPHFANQQFQFTVSGPAGSNAVVYGNTNLADAPWVPLATNGLNLGSLLFTDPLATNGPARFYKAGLRP